MIVLLIAVLASLPVLLYQADALRPRGAAEDDGITVV